VIVIYTSCDPTSPTELTFFLCRERDDMTALLASKGQELWMRANVGLPAVQFHGPLAQFAAGWCKACFRGSSHFLSLDLGSLIAIMGVNWLRTNCQLPSGIAVILQLIQRVLPGAVRGNAAAP
jgi:hypothetical protein